MSLAVAGPIIEEVQAPSLRWEALRSAHFEVHYAEGDRVAAEQILAEAEAVWLPLCAEAEYFPTQRTHVLLLPRDGVEGWTWPSWDWIVLSDHPGGVLDRLRGPMDPVRLILRHELGHLLTLKKSKALAEPIESVDLTVSLRSGELDTSVEAALSLSTLGPHWWSEGAAEALLLEAGLGEVGADRAATLRTAVHEDRVLGEAWRTRFGKADWGDSERTYQQGRAFVQWLSTFHGLDLATISEEASRRGGVNPALRALTGLAPRALVIDFRQSLARTELREGPAVTAHGKRRQPAGSWSLWPVLEAQRVSYHSGGHLLVELRAPETIPGLGGSPSWAERLAVPISYGSRSAVVGDRAIVVGADTLRTGIDTTILDRAQLFEVSLSGDWEPGVAEVRKRSRPLAGTEHGLDPALSPDGELAFAQAVEGGTRLMRGPVDGPYETVAGAPGEWWRTPVFLPDGRLFAVHRVGDEAEIAEIAGGEVVYWTASGSDEADLAATPDGRLLFTADLDGHRDAFVMDPVTARIERLTSRLGGAHTPAMSSAGDLVFGDMTAHGVELVGVPATDLLYEDVTSRFHGQRTPGDPLPVPDFEEVAGGGWTPIAMTPFVYLGMSGHRDLDLAGGLSVASRTYRDDADAALAVWLGDESGVSGSWSQRLGPLRLGLSGSHQHWERPRQGDLRGSRSHGLAELTAPTALAELAVGARLARIGIRNAGETGLVAGQLSVRASEVSRRDLAMEGYEVDVGVERGRHDGQAYLQGWVHLDAEARVPRGLGGAWRHHHALLIGADMMQISAGAHPWLRPRAGGVASQSLLGFSAPLPGYPELALTGDVVLVGRLGYRFPLARWRRAIGPWFVEGATFEVDAHAGVVDDQTPGDIGGRLVFRGTVRDARWDLGIRVAWPTTEVRLGDVDGDDVFDVLVGPPRERLHPAVPRLMVELGRVR